MKLLIAAGAAVAANCEPCLKTIVSQLREAGVPAADIRLAIQVGQFVKDKAAANMKNAAAGLTGVEEASVSIACPVSS